MTNSVRQASRAPSATPLRPRLELAVAGERRARREQPRRAVQERRRDDAVVGGRIRPRRNARARATRRSGTRCPTGTPRAARPRGAPQRDPDAATRPPRRPRTRPIAASTAAARAEPRGRRSGARAPTARAPRHRPSRRIRRTCPRTRCPDGPSPAGFGIDRRHPAVGPLVGGEIVEPLRRERLDVVEHRRRVDEHLPVAGETGALALRAVGRDVARVAEQALPGEFVQGVRGARRSQANVADGSQVAVHDDGARGRRHPIRPEHRRSARSGTRASYAAARRHRPARPAEITSSTWPAGSRSPVAKTNARRFSIETSPSASSTSPCVRVRWVSRGPRSSRRSQPLMLRPTSITTVPSRGRVTAAGASVSMRRTRTADASTSRSRSS